MESGIYFNIELFVVSATEILFAGDFVNNIIIILFSFYLCQAANP